MRLNRVLLEGAWLGEDKGVREFRKHVSWYLKGFAVGGETRQQLGLVSSLSELDDLLGTVDLNQAFPKMTLGAGYGDWNVPWAQWLTGGSVPTR